MIDTHAHLDFPQFDEDREEVISRFLNNGVKNIINIGVDLETSKKSIALAEKYDGIFASVGLHPDFFSKTEKDLRFTIYDLREKINELKILAKNKKVVAIGETGLDYYSHTNDPINNVQKENQKRGFLAQIEIAEELDLPVIVHCREAWDDLYEIVKSQCQNPKSKIRKNRNILNTKYQILDTKFVLHCYSGEKKDTEKFLKLPNVCFSFSGNITYPPRKSSHPSVPPRAGHLPSGRGGGLIEEIIKMIPLDRIMLDSDSPFLAPQEFRGKRNEPIFVKYIAKKIAEIKGISFEEVEQATDGNAERFFGI